MSIFKPLITLQCIFVAPTSGAQNIKPLLLDNYLFCLDIMMDFYYLENAIIHEIQFGYSFDG